MGVKKALNGGQRLRGILTGHDERHLRLIAGSQHHEAHDAVPAGQCTFGFDIHTAMEWPQRFDQQCTGPGVQSVFEVYSKGLIQGRDICRAVPGLVSFLRSNDFCVHITKRSRVLGFEHTATVRSVRIEGGVAGLRFGSAIHAKSFDDNLGKPHSPRQ